jgi:hypothetical protein
MSFSDKVKNEVIREKNVNDCCHLAELSAIIKVEGSLEIINNGLALKMVSQRAVVARELYKLLKEKYNFNTEIKVGKRSSFNKDNYYIIKLLPQDGIKELLVECGLIDSGYKISYSIKKGFLDTSCCRRSYLKGLFLASGMIAHPKSEYHLEFFVKYEEYVKELESLFSLFEIVVKERERNGDYSIYVKRADDIIKILNLIGANSAQLKFENIRVMKEVKNDVNRKVNLETANLSRTAIAAKDQLEDIEIIDRFKGLNKISKSLRETAYLRRDNPYASLKELGEILGLSKSGVNHRFRRIRKIADRFRTNIAD